MVKSIGVTQTLLQTNSIERVQQVQQQHPDTQQRYFEIELEQEKRRSKEKLKESEKSKQAFIKDEDPGRGNRHSLFEGSDSRPPASGEEKELPVTAETGGAIDVKV